MFVFQLIFELLSQTLLFLLEDVLNIMLLRCLRGQTLHNSTIHIRAEDASDIDVSDDSNGMCIFSIFHHGKLNCVVSNCTVHSVDGCKFPMAIKLGRVTSVPKFTK